MRIDGFDMSQQAEIQGKQSEEVRYNLLQVTKSEEGKGNFFNPKLEEGVEELNDTVDALHRDLKFKIHEGSDRMMVEVINLDNNEVIKEIPQKEVLDMIGRIREMVGLLIDEKI